MGIVKKTWRLRLVSPSGIVYQLVNRRPDDEEDAEEVDYCKGCAFGKGGFCDCPMPEAEEFCHIYLGYNWQRLWSDSDWEEYQVKRMTMLERRNEKRRK